MKFGDVSFKNIKCVELVYDIYRPMGIKHVFTIILGEQGIAISLTDQHTSQAQPFVHCSLVLFQSVWFSLSERDSRG